MSDFTCPQCGAPLPEGTTKCKFCGEVITVAAAPQQAQYQQQPQYQQTAQQPQIVIQQVAPQQPQGDPAISPYWPVKSKVAAGILALLLGGIGVHMFYMGKIGAGILMLLFCWTGIPAIVGFIQGIIYLCQSDRDFSIKNQVRTS